MNPSPHFRETRTEVLQDLIRAHPFATLISHAGGMLSADHVPLVLHGDVGACGVLRGHLAAANPLAGALEDPLDVLAVFQGDDHYVTPGWYPSKADHGRVVPTWNYVAVHARGRLRFRRDTGWLMDHLSTLTDSHEAGRAAPWFVADAPADFVARQLRALIGFEIAIEDLQGTWKLSQNRSPADRDGVVAGLSADATQTGQRLAALVRDRAPGA